jgi:H+/Na+-translocating ferredoxin:NAD+ oxidoreductase subunit B
VVLSLCNGCELCIAPCPVDCISMVPAGRAWSIADADAARARFAARNARNAARARQAHCATSRARDDAEQTRRRDAVARALARARARRAARSGAPR